MSGGVKGLAKVIKECVDKRIEFEARAKRGILKNGLFYSGSNSYAANQAVEVNSNSKVWAVRSAYGAVVVGQ